jgi:AraC family transcriptional regulator
MGMNEPGVLPAVASTLTFFADDYRGGTRHYPHVHDALHFSIVLSGQVAETVGAVTEYGAALSVVAKDPGVRHANAFGPDGARLARLTLPSATIGDLVGSPDTTPGWTWSHDPRVARPFLRLVRRAGGQSASFSATDPDLVDLLEAFTARPGPAAAGIPPAWLRQVMAELREDWSPSLSVPLLALRAGVHPVYLARCVRRWFGTGLAEELRRQRLCSAAARLPSPGFTVSDVAHATGYSDESHLNRAFSEATGLTPGRFRALMRLQPFRSRGTASPAD